MLALTKWRHTVIDETCGTAPYYDITVCEMETSNAIGSAFAAPEEHGVDTQ